MPTAHVTPGCDQLLQEIADSLYKARKVLVVTGAGISTNSGIPDFRSENGLYSLIQAQFDEAAKTAASQTGEQDDGSDLTDDIDLRPQKRRRLSLHDPSHANESGSKLVFPGLVLKNQGNQEEAKREVKAEVLTRATAGDCFFQQQQRLQDEGQDGADRGPSADKGEALEDVEVAVVLPPSPRQSTNTTPSTAVISSPNLDPPQQPLDNATSNKGPPTKFSKPTPPSSRTPTPKISHLGTSLPPLESQSSSPLSSPLSSSPLSSPPPNLFDPYQQPFVGSSPPCSQSDSLCENSTASSESGETPPSSNPSVAPQTSTSNRTTLPNLKGRDLFDASIWQDPVKTSVFYTFATTLRKKVRDVEPTVTHHFISLLRDSQKLVRCYTQNIDQLEEKVGLTTSLGLGPGHRYRFSARPSRASRGPSQLVQEQRPETVAAQAELPLASMDQVCQEQYEEEGARLSEHSPDAGTAKNGGYAQDSQDTEASQAPRPPAFQDAPFPQDSPGADAQVSQEENPAGPDFGRPAETSDAAPEASQPEHTLSCPASTGDIHSDSPHAGGGVAALPGLDPAAPAVRSVDASVHDCEPRRTTGASDVHPPIAVVRGPTALPSSGPTGLPVPVARLSEPSPVHLSAGQQVAQLPPPRGGVECVYLHGSLERLRCFQCSRTSDWNDIGIQTETLSGRQPDCPHCAGATAARQERGKRALGVGKLRPDIVLYGEEHPHNHLISPIVQHDLGLGPDLLLILGTSLRVHGLKILVKEFSKAVHTRGGKVVFINFTKPSDSVWADIIDYWIQWDCDAWIENLKERKPAIWSPGKNAIDDALDGASSKLRRESSGESVKTRRASTGLAKKARKEGGVAKSKPKRESSGAEELKARAQSGSLEKPKAKPKSKPKPERQSSGVQKPEAKRPMAVRDSKDNAAFLTWKIMEELKRITGSPLISTPKAQPVPRMSALTPAPKSELKPKLKKARKSAPAAIGGGNIKQEEVVKQPTSEKKIGSTKPRLTRTPLPNGKPAAASSPLAVLEVATSVPCVMAPSGDSASVDGSSILAAVKSNPRRRKRKMIDGVEVVLPAIQSKLVASGKTATKAEDKSVRLLPKPVTPEHMTFGREDAQFNGSPGGKFCEQLASYKTSPNTSPPIVVAPLRNIPLEIPHERRLEQLEPRSLTTGPLSSISPNVGTGKTIRLVPNPFYISDPLTQTLRHPPAWMATVVDSTPSGSEGGRNREAEKREMEIRLRVLARRLGGMDIGAASTEAECSPAQQLIREAEEAQEAAVALAMMMGGGSP